MGERMKGLLGMLGKKLGMTEAVNPQARLQTGGALPTGQDQFNIAKERADIPSPRADWAPKQSIAQNTGYGLTQEMMRDFDPSDNDQVLQMQQAMNAAGIKGADGKALTEDGMLGPNTMRALRFAQGQGDEMSGKLESANELRDKGIDDLPPGFHGPAPNTLMTRPEDRNAQTREANPRGSGTNRFGTAQGGRFY